MSLHNAIPIKFSPIGLSDALDSTNVPPGVCTQLANLIPDPSTKNLWQCRPAAILKAAFASGGFSSPGMISVMKVLGTVVYGMIASALNATHDQPFAYDLVAGSFKTITGITSGNTPVSPATTGDWTPPTMDLIGQYLIVTHPGYSGAGGVMFGYFNIDNPAAITWSAGNTATNALPSPPTAVKQFFNRAYFLVNPPGSIPAAYFTDVLNPLNITLGTNILTFGDNVALTALGTLMQTNQLGGIIQSLIVFKGAAQMWQITGDAALSTLSLNSMNVATGTLAPNSICATPKGMAFIAPDGMRVVNFQGIVSDPVGDAGAGVVEPFIFAISPSRIAAACSGKTIRISVQNGNATGSPNQEYWYDIPRGCWSGPHSFPASQIQVYNNTFIVAPISVVAELFQSDAEQSLTSTYVENSVQLTHTFQTSMLPNTQQMSENAMIETTLNIALAAGVNVNVSAVDENGSAYSAAVIVGPAQTTIWGAFIWGAALWQGAANALAPRQPQWPIPIVFQRLSIMAKANSAAGMKYGDVYLRYQQLGYLLQAL
jgi:hypothetical protein